MVITATGNPTKSQPTSTTNISTQSSPRVLTTVLLDGSTTTATAHAPVVYCDDSTYSNPYFSRSIPTTLTKRNLLDRDISPTVSLCTLPTDIYLLGPPPDLGPPSSTEDVNEEPSDVYVQFEDGSTLGKPPVLDARDDVQLRVPKCLGCSSRTWWGNLCQIYHDEGLTLRDNLDTIKSRIPDDATYSRGDTVYCHNWVHNKTVCSEIPRPAMNHALCIHMKDTKKTAQGRDIKIALDKLMDANCEVCSQSKYAKGYLVVDFYS
ncbi:MAG: hypothetical protein M1834_007452 [Cirrosporium novae-zelandiae]|nr:MAG: hypothetical protein M1834_007452 [Cirrosporium novae-zelandiae]